MATAGVRHGRIYYEPNCPPIPFHGRPFAFMTLCVFYLALSATLAVVAVQVATRLLATP
jgi:hypothetical protein